MSTLGEKLRRARLEKGLTIPELATRMKVGAKFLEAIEADRRDELPAGFFFRNWTLQYARALSLDEKEIQDQIDGILRADAPLPLPGQEQPRSKSWARPGLGMRGGEGSPRLLFSFSLLFLVVLGCSGFYAWWHQQKQERSVSAAPSPRDPAAVASTQPAPVGTAQRQSTERQKLPITEPGAPAGAVASNALLLEIFAREQTWLSISPDGRQVFSGVLEPNESKTVEAKESARLKIGNAGGLDVRLNGKPLGDIGPKGQVRILFVGHNGVHIVGSRSSTKPDASISGESDRSAPLALPLQ